MGNDNLLIGIGDAAFIPKRQGRKRFCFLAQNVVDRGFGKNQAFEQGIGSQTIGTMQSGTRSFTSNVQIGNIGPAVEVADDPATGVVSGRDDRNGGLGDVDAQLEATGVDITLPLWSSVTRAAARGSSVGS